MNAFALTASRLKAAAALVLMVLAFAGAHAWKPTLHMADTKGRVELESLFPRTIGGWVVDDRLPVQLVSPDQQAVLDKLYNQVLSRVYINAAGERVMLSVAYGGDQSDATRAHRPEVCYPAQGFQVVSQNDTQLALDEGPLPVRRLVTRLGGRVEPVTYWIVVGDRVALSGTQQKLAQLRYSVRGVIPDGMLVRVSTIDPDTARSFRQQDAFLTALEKSLPAARRSAVFGGAAPA